MPEGRKAAGEATCKEELVKLNGYLLLSTEKLKGHGSKWGHQGRSSSCCFSPY